MQYYKKKLPLFLILITSSVFGKITSHVTNNTSNTIIVYWTAAGCGAIHNGVTETCKYQHIQPNTTSVYVFKSLQTNLQIKVDALCKKNSNTSEKTYSFFCPSGSWHLGDADDSSRATCKLQGKGRGHVRSVIIDNFNAYKAASASCKNLSSG